MKNKVVMIGLVLAMNFGMIQQAEAHEKRFVQSRYHFVVGFLNEPAFSGGMNGIDLRVSDADSGAPVTGLESALIAEVWTPEQTNPMKLPLRRRYGQEGAYGAYFLPARPGPYHFRIHGVMDGVAIDEEFVSGKETFANVEDSNPLVFPPLAE
jgi:hypothetical protein